MKLEEKIYQFGTFVFDQKNELIPSLPRSQKGYYQDGVYDGKADSYGFGRPYLEQYKIDYTWTFVDDYNNEVDWAVLVNKLVMAGKQIVFFTNVNDRYKTGDPVITYNYGTINLDNEYYQKYKKIKFSLTLDSPAFFDCTQSVSFLANNAIIPPQNLWSSAISWTTAPTWGASLPYQSVNAMSASDILANFGENNFDGKGQLYLQDQFFFEKIWTAPTFGGSRDYNKSILTTDWYNATSYFQTTIVLNNLQLNGSDANSCFVMSIDKVFNPGDYVEIINENNLTGIRLENIGTDIIYGFNFYNYQNQEIYDNFGKKINIDNLQVRKLIPDTVLDYLRFDTNINTNQTYYPSIRIYANNNTATNIRIKNQRIYN